MPNTDINNGLSEIEAQLLLKKDGLNEIPSQKRHSSLSVFFTVLSEPMLLLLIGCGTVYLFMGEVRDALMLLAFVFIVTGITFYQKRKTEKTLEALKDFSSPRALVIRDGQQRRIAGKEVVRGDIIIIREGDRVPADAVVLSSDNLCVNESLLTGESMPVRKSNWDGQASKTRPGGDDLPFIYSGSMVISGRGVAMVDGIGLDTEIGKIGRSLESIKDEKTLLSVEISKIVRVVAILSVIICVVVIAIHVIIRGDVVGGFLAGLSLSMALLPEEFPVILMIFITMGAWRISKNKVLTRRAAAIETLGAATVLCTDKTGTLTLNKMELSCLYADESFYDVNSFLSDNLSPQLKRLLEYGVLASQKDPYDPIEKELNKIGSLYLKDSGVMSGDLLLVKEFPLSKELLALSHAWQAKDGQQLIVASKGAPEAILDLCHVDEKERNRIIEKIKEMSTKGLRVLGVAEAIWHGGGLPSSQHDFDFKFLGLLGFIDPIRETVPEAVRETYAAGMRVIMITGDYPGTAQFIARKIGIKNSGSYLTGEDLNRLSDNELREKIKEVNIFARVLPEQKLLIVNALKANNEIAAMTGDGVNDAPALKSAHIGVAMGERGTDVAREASSLVLLNDDFSSIVKAVRLGRRIYDNLKRAMGYALAVHVPIAGMSILPLAFDMPMVLLPAHIAFLELIIDPACSSVFESEKEARDIMNRPPRNLKQSIFNKKTVSISLLQGFGVLIATFALFVYAIKSGKSELEARSFAFVSLVLSNLIMIVINLSWSKSVYQIFRSANKILIIVIVGTLACLLAVLNTPFLSELFHVAPLHIPDIMLIGLVSIVSLGWFEVFKASRQLT